MRMRMETPIIPPAIPSTNSGLTLIPLVSSSKNRSNPALEAGSGAFFFLLSAHCYSLEDLNTVK